MTTIGEPSIDERPERPYLGIRVRTPMKGMGATTDKLRKELAKWLKTHGVAAAGPPFRRFHVIDMAGEMDITVGVPVAAVRAGDGRVTADVLPAGRYASLVFSGSGLTGNKALIEWAKANGIAWDRWDDARGDAFRCRCETYLTDAAVEQRKTKQQIEVAIKLAE